MPVRLLPWQPEYGTAMQFDADAPDFGDGDDVVVDLRVEHDTWAPVTSQAPVDRVYLVDGVRRAEAHAIDDVGGGMPAFGLFGSYATGAVALEEGRARVMPERVRVERRYLHTSHAEVPDRVLSFQRTALTFASRTVPTASRANDLVAALNRAMLDEEARLAESLSEDESALTLVDGPLRSLRAPGRRVVGYVKRIQQWYVPRSELELLQTLDPRQCERTPLFHIPASGDDPNHLAEGRYSWFVRLPVTGPHLHYLGGVLRLECAASISLERAVTLADQAATLLPRLASSPARDPRAPQNLTPVGALERHLTHLLGDRRLISRLLAASIAREEAA